MNGRVYDYNVGRFMSVDPVIQAPGNSQSINPYSYIMNNPLAGTDPTGYQSERAFKVEIKVQVKTGSRITSTQTVTATVTSDGNGGSEITFSGASNGALSAAKAATATLSSAGFTVTDIGSQNSISSNSQSSGLNDLSTWASESQMLNWQERKNEANQKTEHARDILNSEYGTLPGAIATANSLISQANAEMDSIAHEIACAMDKCGLVLSTPITNLIGFKHAARIALAAARKSFN